MRCFFPPPAPVLSPFVTGTSHSSALQLITRMRSVHARQTGATRAISVELEEPEGRKRKDTCTKMQYASRYQYLRITQMLNLYWFVMLCSSARATCTRGRHFMSRGRPAARGTARQYLYTLLKRPDY